MYQSYFKLKKIPFQNSTNPEFIWPGRSVKKKLIAVRKDILNKSVISILTGDLGTGKSTMASILAENLSRKNNAGVMIDPEAGELELLNTIAHALRLTGTFTSRETFFRHFEQHLTTTHSAGKQSILIIDEAQGLDCEKLDVIATLANMKIRSSRVLRVLLIGHTSLLDNLSQSQNSELKALLTGRHIILPLTAVESADYIRSRMQFAGTHQQLFTADAIRAIHLHAGGILRQINTICDNALFKAFIVKQNEVTVEIVRNVAQKFDLLSAQQKEEVINSEPSSEHEKFHFTVTPRFITAGTAMAICLLGVLVLYNYFAESILSSPVVATDRKILLIEPMQVSPKSESILPNIPEKKHIQVASGNSSGITNGQPQDMVANPSSLLQRAVNAEVSTPEKVKEENTVVSVLTPEKTGTRQRSAIMTQKPDQDVDYQAYTEVPDDKPKEKNEREDADADLRAIID